MTDVLPALPHRAAGPPEQPMTEPPLSWKAVMTLFWLAGVAGTCVALLVDRLTR